MIVRPIEADDIAAVMRLDKLALPSPWNADLMVWFLEKYHGIVARDWELHPAHLGHAMYSFAKKYIELENLAVEPKRRSKGIGKALVDYLKDCGYPIRAWVRADNERGLKFYEREGFRVLYRKRYKYGAATAVRILWVPA